MEIQKTEAYYWRQMNYNCGQKLRLISVTATVNAT